MGGYSSLPSQTPKKREHSEKFSALRAKMIPIFCACEVLGGKHTPTSGGVQLFSGGVNGENPVGGGVYPPTTPPVGETLEGI